MTVQTATNATNENTPTVGGRIRAAREESDFTRKALAELVGVSAKTIEKWEDGTRQPPIKRLEALSEHLEVPVSYFVGGNSPEETTGEIPAGYDPAEPTESVSGEVASDKHGNDYDMEMSAEASILNALDHLDALRKSGFQNSSRKVAALVDQVHINMHSLEPDELLHVASVRGLFQDECASLSDLLELFKFNLEEGQNYCGIVEERIIDTAILGIDLYWIEREPLIGLIDKFGIEHPNEYALVKDWGDHEFFVPHLRSRLRSAAIVGNGEPLTDEDQFPRLIEVTDEALS